LSRLATAFVLGYHGCDRETAVKAVNGEINLLHSDESYDWLGPGAYFWEADPRRALEWAEQKAFKGAYAEPAVVGAVIDLRNCLDFANRDDLELLKAAYEGFAALQDAAGVSIKENKAVPHEADLDRKLRYRDCAAIRHLHTMVSQAGLEPYDTVRGIFPEGEELYPGSGFARLTHTQIAVRNNECIRGIFWPRPAI
jgi:hypothetical protein